MSSELRIKRGELAYRATWDSEDVRLAIYESSYPDGNSKVQAVNVDTGVVFSEISEPGALPLPRGYFQLRDWDSVNEFAVTLVSVGIIESADESGFFFRFPDLG